jgi:hypothetical protein
MKELNDEAYYEEEEGVWLFSKGGQCGVCTEGAIRISIRFGGILYGYESKANPSAFIGGDNCFGHDFVIVDRKYLVDFWAYSFAAIIKQPLFDLTNRSERAKVAYYYGPSNKWVPYDTLDMQLSFLF